MLRSALLRLSRSQSARRLAESAAARRAARRFVAGPRLADALGAVHQLRQKGLFTTLDHLGENVTRLEDAEVATQAYLSLVEALAHGGLPSNASLKLTQLGLRLDRQACASHLRRIAQRAAELHMFLRVDMEDSSAVDPTLEICRALRAEGLANLGVVIQAYLYRSQADIDLLLREGFRIRLVKGAYQEAEPVAFQSKSQVDANFDTLAWQILQHAQRVPDSWGSKDGRVPPIAAIATHDELRITQVERHAHQLRLPPAGLEFQMLYGIRPDLQLALASKGYPTRVYVPYGTEWFPYFMRRLAERPANLGFLLRNVARL
ncbi:MAG: proline dehydrogenase family protein [Anaerolineales bacterium]